MYIPLLKCNKVNQVLSQIVLISVSGTCGQNSRRITFLTPVGGFYLEGHVFSNHSVELNLDCQDQCALARECVSYNIGPKINNKMACELSNSDDFQHPEDLKPRKDWIYRGTKVWSVNLNNFISCNNCNPIKVCHESIKRLLLLQIMLSSQDEFWTISTIM